MFMETTMGTCMCKYSRFVNAFKKSRVPMQDMSNMLLFDAKLKCAHYIEVLLLSLLQSISTFF